MGSAENRDIVAGNVEDLSVPLHRRGDGGQGLVGAVDRDLRVSPDALALPRAVVDGFGAGETCGWKGDQ